MRKTIQRLSLLALLWSLGVPYAVHAIIVTPTQNATTLVNALLGAGDTGIVVTGVTLSGHVQDTFEPPGTFWTSSGTFTNASGTYGVGAGVVLSTGGVELYADGPNTADDTSGVFFTPTFELAAATPAQELLLDPITTVGEDSFQHFDVTELVVQFDMETGFDSVRFNVVFGSEEFPEYVSIGYFDGFGLFLNGTNVAFVASKPVNITHPDMKDLAGTELDGVLAPGGTPLLTFGGAVNPTGNTLRFLIGDRDDSILDSTVYVSGLRAAVPEPGATALTITAMGMLGLRARSRRSGRRPRLHQGWTRTARDE